jgi:hypothetical protein
MIPIASQKTLGSQNSLLSLPRGSRTLASASAHKNTQIPGGIALSRPLGAKSASSSRRKWNRQLRWGINSRGGAGGCAGAESTAVVNQQPRRWIYRHEVVNRRSRRSLGVLVGGGAREVSGTRKLGRGWGRRSSGGAGGARWGGGRRRSYVKPSGRWRPPICVASGGGRRTAGVWRTRFLISVISANGQISRVKPADIGQT